MRLFPQFGQLKNFLLLSILVETFFIDSYLSS
jgi:hypothetical protein